MFANSTILITGGTGTLGQELVRQLSDYGCKEIRVYSRSEVAQVEMKRKYPDVNYIIGDIRNYMALYFAMKGSDYVVHCAALKHVGICETQTYEAIQTNVIGLTNVIRAAQGNKVIQLVNISTDKSVNPVSAYGLTKALGEKLILNAGYINVRSGNIFASSGSVIPYFIDRVEKCNEIPLTDETMTRYFGRVEDIARFVLRKMEIGHSGTYTMDMVAFLMRDIAEAIKEVYGNSETKITQSGAKPGEKIHESLNYTDSSADHLAPKETIIKWLRQF